MMKIATLFTIFAFSVLAVNAQLWPAPGAELNYTQVMFECMPMTGVQQYRIQVIEDTLAADFEKAQIDVLDSATTMLVTGLQWGKKYKWRYAGISSTGAPAWSGTYHFSTASPQESGRTNFKIGALINKTGKHNGGLIVTDMGSIINRQGEVVWFLPQATANQRTTGVLRDLRITPYNTVTFLSGMPYAQAFECDLNGSVLWQAPNDGKVSGDTTEYYHHAFIRLPNGNYMVLGNRFAWKKIPQQFVALANRPIPGVPADSMHRSEGGTKLINGELYARVQYGTIIEYNKNKDVVWRSDCENYLKDEEIFPLLFTGATLPPGMMPATTANDRDAHMNAFSVDEANRFVYAGFRQLNRLVKIEKQTGKVVSEWGGNTVNFAGAPMFHQHSAEVTASGNVLVYDNGDMQMADRASRILKLSPPTESKQAEVLFDFETRIDTLLFKSDRGGNVEELPGGNVLACTGFGAPQRPGAVMPAGGVPAQGMPQGMPVAMPPVGNANLKMQPGADRGAQSCVFEVTPQKEVVWCAVLSNCQMPPYRAHFTPSLYPTYFTALTKGAFTAAKGATVVIQNKGGLADSWELTYRFKKAGFAGKVVALSTTAGNTRQVSVLPATLPNQSDTLEITVASKTNPEFKRNLIIEYKK